MLVSGLAVTICHGQLLPFWGDDQQNFKLEHVVVLHAEWESFGGISMQFPGYWVSIANDGKVSIARTCFDETELDPATDWKEAWQNQERDGLTKGFINLDQALACAASYLRGEAG